MKTITIIFATIAIPILLIIAPSYYETRNKIFRKEELTEEDKRRMKINLIITGILALIAIVLVRINALQG